MLLLTLLLCGAHLAQDVAAGTQGVGESASSCPDIGSLQRELRALMERQTSVEASLTDAQSQIAELNSKAKSTVVFSATTDEIGAFGPFNTHTNILYKKAITNVGGAYNPSTGIFTAPVSGIYYFSFFSHSGGNRFVYLQLMKNEEFIVGIYDHQTSHDGADNGANAAFVQLRQGDQVSVRLTANTQVWGEGSLTTFSGFLLSQE
ncbi:complement C1q tumor necrosis factor-related protein 3 [Oryzias melastigma]|uniref:Complement C1q tumor necrosis factor-related protein 3-like n=1 Tax=Oryzias melastigma TaxID=30732 RepID=A0A3B3CS89_ORYME|nr:complement C1q tumor necrosis factor-related protein 3 [Oryzias melastigma]